MRDFLNAILSLIGATSLTDTEFEGIQSTSIGYNQSTYDDLANVLESREAISDQQERLKFYYLSRGIQITPKDTGKSNIYIGDAL